MPKTKISRKAEKAKVKKLKPQIQERNAYNRMQRGQTMNPAARKAAADFIAKGKPKPKW